MQRRRLGRMATTAMALALAGVLAACSGDAPALLTGAAPAGSGDSSAASTPDKPAFNPFSDRSEADTPARVVIEKPTREEIMKPGPLPEFTLGRADAPVVIVKYMSLTCPYCRRFMAETFPVLKRDYIDKGHVRLVLREFPIGKTSGTATIALRCAPMDKYLPLYEKFLQQQSAWVSQEVRPDAIFKVAQQVGLTREKFDACLKDQALIDALKQIKDRGRTLGIIGTPNFFVETRLVKKVVGMPELRELIDPLLAGKVAGR